jgi:uncharacterized protein YceH (UPF0502 family)
MKLSAEEARVVGSLVEKELTTPQQYPLTLNALVSACNQASNRDPVVSYDEHTVMSVLNDLKAQRLIRFVLPSHGRTAVRYRHVLDEALALDRRQCALFAVLLLRGPQTLGELRIRTDRMAEFAGLNELEHELEFMASLEAPLARRLERRPGQKEERWMSPIVEVGAGSMGPQDGVPAHSAYSMEASDDAVRFGDASASLPMDDVRADIARLSSEINQLRADLAALRASLGD